MRKTVTIMLLAVSAVSFARQVTVVSDTDTDITPCIFRDHSYLIECDNSIDRADITGWMVCLPTTDNGDMHIIAAGKENRRFTVEALTLDDLTGNYITDSHGICMARFYVFAETGGETRSFEQDVPVSLAPWLGSPDILSYNATDRDYIYTVTYSMAFAGVEDNRIKTAVEEEYSSTLATEYLYPDSSPFTATSKSFNNLYYAWLRIEAGNRFGHTDIQYEITPGSAGITGPGADDVAADRFAVHSTSGIRVADTRCESEIGLLPPGIYIILKYAGDRLIETAKKAVH